MARILIAEDDVAVQSFVSRALTHRGHKVTAVDDGVQALETLGGDGFDLLITDIVMPAATIPSCRSCS
jgi:CheY-like chemotaxis protein